jgi:hypothetical protein
MTLLGSSAGGAMSIERAQKSEVHETTDDSASSPAGRTDPDPVTTRASDAGRLDVANVRSRVR